LSRDYQHINPYIQALLNDIGPEKLHQQLSPKHHESPPHIAHRPNCDIDGVNARWCQLNVDEHAKAQLLDAQTIAQLPVFEHNIENLIGTVKLPVGLAGPLRVNGMFAQGDYYIPLATSEAALVASYSRGAVLISKAGGCSSMLLSEGVSRAPAFAFANIIEAGEFVRWAVQQVDTFKSIAETTSRHAKLSDMRVTVEGNHVYLGFEYLTGDAAGQNMVTIATDAVVQHIAQHSPTKPQYFFVEGNLSGDKKASALSFLSVRGKKVSAEVTLPEKLVRAVLHTTPKQMVDYWRMSAIGGVLSGTIGVQGHYANGLAALYIACGQDAACVSESAVGVTRMEVTDNNELYASVTLPNLIVGTVGGGTKLPSQKACLDIMGLAGHGHARAFAEVCASLALAGELSIIGALTAGHFTSAHQRLARGDATGKADDK